MARTKSAILREANRAILVEGDLGTIERVFAPGFLAHGTAGRDLVGVAGVRRFVTALRRAFPTLEVEVEILLEGRDRVAWQRTLRGVQKAACKGFPASGRKLVWRDMIVSRFADGLVAEDWVLTDLAEQLLRARARAR